MWIRFSGATTFVTRTVLPDLDGPEIDTIILGMLKAYRRSSSKFLLARSTYVRVGTSVGSENLGGLNHGSLY
jgi:hypothetical protein